MYNPSWKGAKWQLYAICQQARFSALNQYNLSIGAADLNAWFGAYHVQTQRMGPGVDNRRVLSRPGLPDSKPPDVNPDMINESVRGYAFDRWMREARKDRERFLNLRRRPAA